MLPSPLVLDSWAVLAFVEDQDAAPKVEKLLDESRANVHELWISSVNLGEVWYILARRKSEDVADRAQAELLRTGVRVADVDQALALRAARLKAKHAIAYADCFAAALAQQLKTKVITGDPEFRRLEKDVKLLWVGA